VTHVFRCIYSRAEKRLCGLVETELGRSGSPVPGQINLSRDGKQPGEILAAFCAAGRFFPDPRALFDCRFRLLIASERRRPTDSDHVDAREWG
jgi:hypothetical protein